MREDKKEVGGSPCTVTVAVLVVEKLLVSVRAAVQRNWTVVEAVDSVPLIRLT